jgi:hypothetical protein
MTTFSSEVTNAKSRRIRKLASIDVVVPCYNYGRFLRQCTESVLTQTGVDVRVLVIDDASPDNTAEVATALARDPRVAVRRHVTNQGHIATYNEGLEWASADYTLLLSADDYLLPGALCRVSNLMDASPEVGFTFGNAIELSVSGHETRTRSVAGAANSSDACVLRGREFIVLSGVNNLVPTCTAVVRTELQKRLGGYRYQLPHTGDMEMWLRFAAHASVGFIPEYQGVYRQHGVNMSTAYYSVIDGRLTYLRHGRLADLQQRKSALDCFAERCHDVLPASDDLLRRLYRQLANSGVSHASAAFNDGHMNEFRELSNFALAVCPKIASSPAWLKLSTKRWMGARTWRAIAPAAAAVLRSVHRREA